MKKLLSMLCVIVTLFACSESDQDNSKTLIQDLQMPSSDIPFIENQLVTIQGKGFTSTSQIWLRASGTKAQGDIQAEVTQANDKSLTFKVPANTIGKKEIILKQDGQEYLLGTLTFKEKERYYTFCYEDDKKELAEIDIESGNLIWTGLKMPEYQASRGYVFNESGSELIAFDAYDKITNKPVIFRLNMATKEVKKIGVKNLNGAGNFNDIIRLNNKYYTFCYDSDKKELAEIDIESGNLIWTGLKMPEYQASRGFVFNESGSELIAFDVYDKITDGPVIFRLNMATKEVKKIEVENLNGAGNFNDIIRLNNKYYAFCYDDDKKELAEIDIESGNLIWSGLKMPEYQASRGYVFNQSGSELIAFDTCDDQFKSKIVIFRLNMTTKEVKKTELKNLNGALDFNHIIRK